MSISLTDVIIAVVVKEECKNKVTGSAPIFIVDSNDELERMSMLLSRITQAMVHELSDGLRIIVKH